MMGLAMTCCYAALAGVTAHLGYFIHGERHEQAPAVVALSFLTTTTLFWVELLYLHQGFVVAALTTTAISTSFAFSLWTSMLFYRLFFHPLRNFPGPTAAKASKFWHAYNTIPKFQGFLWLDRMHHEYGDFVRTGKSRNQTSMECC